MDVSSTTLFIWAVRIALPLVFFLLWWRQPKEHAWVDTGPQTGRHGRSALLQVRGAVKACAAPSALATIKLVEDTSRPAGGSGAPRAPIRRERGERGARERRAPASGKREKVTKAITGLEDPNLTDEDRKHLESLLNYVAFNRKQQEEKALGGSSSPSSPVRTTVAEPATAAAKANQEAQSVLKGSVNQQLGETSAVVAKDLFKKLSGDGIAVEESTFSMMIQACLYAGDLKGASDFLMQMETAGMCPDSSVLDQVMGLYTQYKVYGYDAPGDGVDYGYSWGAEVAPQTQQMWSAAWLPDADSVAAAPAEAATSRGKPGAKSSFNFDAYSDDDDE